jgi:cytoskeletal protein RodZ
MRCPYCGKENSAEYTFCLNCGSRLDDDFETKTATIPLAQNIPSEQSPKIEKTNGNQVNRIFLIILSALVFLGLLGVAGYFYKKVEKLEEQVTRRSVEQPSTVASTPTPQPKPTKEFKPSPSPTQDNTPKEQPTRLPAPVSSSTPETVAPQIRYERLGRPVWRVPANEHAAVTFSTHARVTKVVGNFYVASHDIQVLLFDNQGRSYYDSGRAERGHVDVNLPPGTYILSFNNHYAVFFTKVVYSEIYLGYLD